MFFLSVHLMNTLFPVDPLYPEGFSYVPDFISIEEEAALLGEIEKTPLHTFIFQGYEAKRKVASFGYDWNFEKRQLSKGKDIPPGFHFLAGKVAQHLSRQPEDFSELLVTEYPEGSTINWHRDAPPFDIIAGISLLSDCTFRLRPYDKAQQNRRSIVSIPAKRRSLYIMQGPSRSEWEHSIPTMKQVRYSITLRTLGKAASY
jgi:alkylated DNA repair dioxygenase AlkB